MRKSFLHYSCLGLFILASCSDEDGGGTPAETSAVNAARPAGGGPGSKPAAPLNPADAGASAPVATGELEPAVPVTENPDHEALLDSPDPALAANKRLVYDVWRTLIEARDTAAAQQYLAEGYIQHNPNADTGRAGVLAFFASLGAPLPVAERVQAKLVAIVAEGDYVAIARVDEYTEPRPYTTTWFDLFRIEGGVIAEHWDHGRLPADGTPSAYVPPAENPDQEGSLESAEPQLEANKRLVHEMWRTLLDGQQVEEAPRFLAEGYVQHNPQANTGLQGFLTFFRQFAQPQPVQPNVANFIQMIAEDDLVVLATVRSYADANGEPYTTTWFDMFRVSDEKLVEHWDTATLQ
jgi:predicted SnoaL-like aldol condensation-catalyzing enzyme